MSRFMRTRYQAMEAYVPGEQPKMTNLAKLNTNENPYAPSPKVLQVLQDEALINSLRLYPDIAADGLITALADCYGLQKNQVLAGNGSDELLAFAFLAFGESGLAFPDISYGFYPVWADLFGIEADVKPLKEDFTIDPADYCGNDRMVVIANPNAPTGLLLSKEQIETILKANPDQVVLIDEAYIDFSDRDAASVDLLQKYENLLIVRTFSKSRSLAGGRLGFALGSAELIEDLNKIKFSFNPYNVNALTMKAGEAAVLDSEYFASTCRKVKEQRQRLTEALEQLGFTVLPSGANFIFAREPEGRGKEWQEALRETGVIVRRFSLPRIQEWVRISIGTAEQTDRLLKETETWLESR
ncbi:MAG: histidinol-phosphate transaminase [Clostridiales bacterium]|nr:histidinol-phosphate transaminase [Clostridiales bacterium]